ncbi:DUF6505 family protein [Chelatococcus albus]|uniref:DUF6505 family protein n=1 Tax=Chelatococcus albus TaxID=3047466 RepID=UPI003BEEFC77
MKLLRTIRLDPSDAFVFERAAEPGEWAVSGAFLFWDLDPATLPAKARVAFRSGILGVASFAWSTLAVVTEATGADRAAAVETLARHLVERLGAPDLATAQAAAEEEVAYAESLCDHPPGTLVAVQRTTESGEMRERFRTLTPRADAPRDVFRAFEFFEVEEGQGPDETVDLLSLTKEGRA